MHAQPKFQAHEFYNHAWQPSHVTKYTLSAQ